MSGAVLPSSSTPFEFPAVPAKDFLGLGGGTGFTLGLGSVLGGCFLFSVSRLEMTEPLWLPLWALLSCFGYSVVL